MSYETEVTTEDQDVSVTKDPDVPGRYQVIKTHVLTRTMMSVSNIDIAVTCEPKPARQVVFGYNASGSKPEALQKMVETYGNPAVCRVFSGPGKGLMAWDSPLLAPLQDDTILVYSFKDWPLDPDAFAKWMDAKPTDRFPEVWWCVDHEPEQGPDEGDSTPEVYRQQWIEALAIHNVHPRRAEFHPVPIFTQYYARKYNITPNPATGKTWYEDFGCVVEFHGVEGIGFDIYDSHEYNDYRSPQERNELSLFYAMQADLPLLICEWNVTQKPEVDPTDERAVQAVRDNVNYLRNEVDHPVPYVMWFHNFGGVLYDRPAVQEAFMQALDANPS